MPAARRIYRRSHGMLMPIARDGYIMPMMMTRACVAQVNLARAIGAFTSARSSRRKSDDSSAYDDESVAEESSKAGLSLIHI